jgi:nucleotide-binding universal stress UspA family protein
MNPVAPIVVCYDGSDTARRAVRETGELFGSRQALVVTVWDPSLPYEAAMMSQGEPDMMTPLGPEMEFLDVEAAQAGEERLQARAHRTAHDGADLASSFGLEAEALVVADDRGNVAGAIVELARERDAAAIVIGSRGLSGLRARLEGSTSSAVLKRSSCPVVVVHDD